MSTYNLKTGDTCSFSIYPEGMIEGDFKNCVFRDRLSYESVSMFGHDAAAEHIRVLPTLPEGSVTDPKDYSWLTFKMSNGELVILGEPWIKQSSVVKDNNAAYTLTIYDGSERTPEDLRLAASSLGYSNYHVEKKS